MTVLDQIREKAKDGIDLLSSLSKEYVSKHQNEEEYYFVEFNPNPTISAYELMQIMILNNTLVSMYGTLLTPLAPVFMSANVYYRLMPAGLLDNHFKFLGSEKISLTEAYDRINNSV